MQSPQLAIRELERCMDELGLQGVQIGSHINGPNDAHWNLDAPELCCLSHGPSLVLGTRLSLQCGSEARVAREA